MQGKIVLPLSAILTKAKHPGAKKHSVISSGQLVWGLIESNITPEAIPGSDLFGYPEDKVIEVLDFLRTKLDLQTKRGSQSTKRKNPTLKTINARSKELKIHHRTLRNLADGANIPPTITTHRNMTEQGYTDEDIEQIKNAYSELAKQDPKLASIKTQAKRLGIHHETLIRLGIDANVPPTPGLFGPSNTLGFGYTNNDIKKIRSFYHKLRKLSKSLESVEAWAEKLDIKYKDLMKLAKGANVPCRLGAFGPKSKLGNAFTPEDIATIERTYKPFNRD